MILGMAGGVLLGVKAESLVPAALFIWFSTLLDCADGQLARLQKSASPIGRILDGSIDYVVGLSVFAGIGIRGAPAVSSTAWWGIVLAAGASYALQAMMYDLFRTEYLEVAGKGKSRREGRAIPVIAPGQNRSRMFQRMYDRYAGFQRFLGSWLGAVEDDERTRRHLRIWGLNGTSTHVLVLVAACFLNRLDLYLMYLIVVGNGLTMGLILAWQSRNNESTRQQHNETTTIEF
jgi:hypothetical protein